MSRFALRPLLMLASLLAAFPATLYAQTTQSVPAQAVPARAVLFIYPAPGATVPVDSELRITFPAAPTLGSGTIEIRNADDVLVDTINVAVAPAQAPAGGQRGGAPGRGNLSFIPGLPTATRAIGGIAGYNYYPVLITADKAGGNQAIITLNKPLPAGQTFTVTLSNALFKLAGEPFALDKPWKFATRPAFAMPEGNDPLTLAVAADGTADFATIQGAIDALPANNQRPAMIRIKSGTYNELVAINGKHNLTLVGEDRAKTILQYPNNANFNPAGNPYRRGMFLAQRCEGLVLANMTFHNTTPQGGSQAESIILNGTVNAKAIITNVDMYSYQDTLQINGQAYVSDCHIEGDVDFIWGTGPCYFENCTIKSLRRGGYFTQIRNRTNHGYIFDNCTFDGTQGGGTGTYLGRIDPGVYPNSEVVLLDCVFPRTGTGPNGQPLNAAADAGWLFNNANANTNLTGIHNWEFNSHDPEGKPIDVSKRNVASKQLDAKNDAETIKNYGDPAWVLGNNWTPDLAPISRAMHSAP